MDNNYKDRLEIVNLQGKELAILEVILHLQRELRKIKAERIKLEKVQ
tara:strand:+ start:144 stop:284 length:141 start_codon:yes stop_codon:yes gene_type:complete